MTTETTALTLPERASARMKPTRQTLIAAIKSGIVTRSALQQHFGDEDLRKALHNLVDGGLAVRYLDEEGAAYKLTEKGRDWKPEQRGAALRAAMRRTA